VRDDKIGDWLDDLASDSSAPGGGAAAALDAAVGAALISMVCNLTTGRPRYAEHDETNKAALDAATRLRNEALELADADEAAFTKVTDAYKLPRNTDEEKAARTAAIQASLIDAAGVPLRTAALCAEVIALAVKIEPTSNTNLISDVAVAAASARAALDSAALNVEINLAAMNDAGTRDRIAGELKTHVASMADADAVVAKVRGRIMG
jgi:formiminotetrahydrofolate cyclodeaminase